MALGDGQLIQRTRSWLTEPMFANTPGMSPEDVARRRALAEALWSQGTGNEPVTSIFGGVNNMLKAFLGGRGMRQAEGSDQFLRTQAEQEAEAAAQRNRDMLSGLTGQLYPYDGRPTQGNADAQFGTPAAPSAGGYDGRPTVANAAAQSVSMDNLTPDQQQFVQMLLPDAMRASQATGIDPRIIIAQAAQETGWGRSAPGNNYFGIKSHGQAGGNTMATTEYVNGQPTQINDSFRAYGSPGESVMGYADFMNQNGRYEPMRTAQGLDAQLAALGQSGYATDPNYAASVGQIARSLSIPGNQQPSGAPTTQNPISPIIRGLINSGDPQGLAMAQTLLQERLAQLAAPPAAPERATLSPGERWVDETGRTIADNPAAPDPSSRLTPYSDAAKIEADVRAGYLSRDAADAQLAALGAPEPDVTAANLRTEIARRPAFANFQAAYPVYLSMVDSFPIDSKAADLNLVYGMAKIFDPTSVVRESEQVLVNSTASLPEWLVGQINSVNGGAALTPETRDALLREAYSRMNSYKTAYSADEDFYRGIAERNSINVADVFPQLPNLPRWDGQPVVATGQRTPATFEQRFNPGGGGVVTMPDGTIIRQIAP